MKKNWLWCMGGVCCVAWAVESPGILAIRERVSPMGVVQTGEQAAAVTSETAVAAPGDVGEATYQKNCVVCHAAGVAGAPRLGDQAAWGARQSKGLDTLVQHVIQGYNAMPARGTCATCSDDDLRATVEYMLKQST